MQQKHNSDEAQRKLHEAYKNCFTSEAGKIVLEDLKTLCNFTTSTWAGDVNQTLINEGQRRVLLRIVNWSDPMFFEKMEPVDAKKTTR